MTEALISSLTATLNNRNLPLSTAASVLYLLTTISTQNERYRMAGSRFATGIVGRSLPERGLHILLADGDKDARNSITRLLQERGHKGELCNVLVEVVPCGFC